MPKARVAFFHTGIGHPVGGSGATRFFIDLYNWYYKSCNSRPVDLFFLTDKPSFNNFQEGDFFATALSKKRFIALITVSNRFKSLFEDLDFILKILIYRIKLVHICQYYRQDHYHRILFIQRLPKFMRPKIVVNFIHCNFPYEYNDTTHPSYEAFHSRFDSMFSDLKIDAVFSWYKLFCEFVTANHLFKHPVVLYPIKHYCCDTEKFFPLPDKTNTVVYAARLDNQKNPMMFLQAVNELVSAGNKDLPNWKFILCGNGLLKNEVLDYIDQKRLKDVVDFRDNVSDMSEFFGKSKCFVSTQSYENFTSLSMNEAMAAGNAIVSRNVGQTNYYVEDGGNGYLLEEDTAHGLANALKKYMADSDATRASLSAASIRMVKEVHSQENFMNELCTFWENLLNKQ